MSRAIYSFAIFAFFVITPTIAYYHWCGFSMLFGFSDTVTGINPACEVEGEKALEGLASQGINHDAQGAIENPLYDPQRTQRNVDQESDVDGSQIAVTQAQTIVERVIVETRNASGFNGVPFEYDDESVLFEDEKISCKDDGDILQWDEGRNRWECDDPTDTVFNEIDEGTVRVASDGSIECRENGDALIWDGGRDEWRCGQVAGTGGAVGSIAVNADGTFTFSDGTGNTTQVAISDLETLTNIAVVGSAIAYTNEDGAVTTIDIASLETTTALVVNPTANSFTYTNEDGIATVVDLSSYLDNTDAQTIGLVGNQLTLANGSAADTVVDLSLYLDNTDLLASTACADGEFLSYDLGTTSWTCEALTGALGGTVTNIATGSGLSGGPITATGTITVDAPTCTATQKLTWNGTAFQCAADIDTDTQLTEAEVDAFANDNGYLTAEIDGSVTNETITGANLTGTNLNIIEAGVTTTVNLASLADTLSGLACASAEVAKWNATSTAWECAPDIDTDTNTQLTEAEVDAFANDNGYLTTEIDGSTTNELITTFAIGAGNILNITDAGGTKGVDLSGFLDNTDILAGLSCADTQIAKWNAVATAWECSSDIDTTLTEAQVDTFVANNGYLTSFTEVDGSVTNELITGANLTGTNLNIIDAGGTTTVNLASLADTLSGLTCADTEVAKWNTTATAWECAPDIDTNTQLTEAEVDTFVANNGYLTSFTEVDGSTTNELNTAVTLTGTNLNVIDAGGTITVSLASLIGTDTLNTLSCADGQIARYNTVATAWECAADVDTNTQLTEAEVDAFANDNGYLTAELDADPTNEYNTTLTLVGNELRLTDGGGTLTQNLGSIDTNTLYTNGSGLSLAGTTFSINAPTCTTTDKLVWNGTAFTCEADVDTDTDTDTTYTAGAGVTLTGTVFSVDSTNVVADFTNLTNIPTGLADGDDDTTYLAGTGLTLTGTTFSATDPSITNETITGANLTGTNLNIIEAGVTTTVSLASLTDTLSGLTCADTELAKWDTATTAWICAVDIDTDTTYTNVSEFTNDAGYLTAATSGDNDDENELITSANLTGNNLNIIDAGGTTTINLSSLADTLSNLTCTPGQVAKWNAGGTAWECATDIDTDTDTTYTAGTGITLTGTAFSIDNANIAPAWANLTGVPADIADGDDDTLFTAGSGLSLTGAQFAVNAPTCTATQKLSWNGTAFQCLTDIDTNTDTDTTYAAGNGIALTGTTFSANAPTCTATEKLTWNGTAFQCAADIDTDTTYTASGGVVLTGTNFTATDPSITNETITGANLTGTNLNIIEAGVTTTVSLASLTDTLSGLTCADTEVAKWNATATAWECAPDIDTDTTYTNVSEFTNDAGYLTATTSGDNDDENELITSANLTGTNLNIIDAGGTTTISLASLSDTLSGLTCADTEIAKWNNTATAWECATDIDTDTTYTGSGGITLTGTNFTSDLGTSIDTLEIENGTIVAADLGTIPVSTFTNDAGYLTTFTEVDGVIGNEYNTTLTLVGNELRLTDGGGTLTQNLGSIDTNTLYTNGSGLSLAGTTFSINAPTCTTTDKLVWNGTAFTCEADVDTDTDTDTTYTAGAGVTLTGTVFSVDSTNVVADFTNLTNIPTGLADGDDDTTYLAGTGLTLTGTTFSATDPSITNETITGANLTGTNLNIIEAGVTTTVSLASLTDTLSGLTCADTELAKWDTATTAWICAVDIDTDTTYTNVSEFTNDAGYLTAATSGDNDDENELITSANLTGNNLNIIDAGGTTTINLSSLADTLSNLTCTPGQVAKWNAGGTAWECATDIDTDTDTTYTAGTGITLTGTAFSIDNANIAPAWANLTGVPADIADGDDDTLFTAGSGLSLTGAQFAVNAPTCTATQKLSWNGTAFQCLTDIDTNTDTDTTYAAGNGIALTGTTFSANAPTCTATEKLTWNGTAFQCAADIDTDTTYTASGGVVLTGTNFTATDPSITNETITGANLTGTNLNIIEAGVTTTVSLASLTDTLSGLTCADTEVAKWNATATAWECAPDIDTDTTYTNVSEFTNDAGYLTATTSGDNDDENELITSANLTGTNLNIIDAGGTTTISLASLSDTLSGLTCADTEIAKWNNTATAWECATDIDTDTTYTGSGGITLTGTNFTSDLGTSIDTLEIENGTIVAADLGTIPVSTFTNDAGYLTTFTEVDGVIGNEYNTTLTLVGNELRLTDGGGTLTQNLGSIDTNTLYTNGSGLSLAGTTFSINAPTCTTTDKLVWNGTAFTCEADVDTDTDTDTTYTAGAGVTLTGTVFSVDSTNVVADFTNLTNIPTGLADGDDDTTYLAGTGLTLTGTTFSAVDTSATNELNTGITLTGTNLSIIDSGGSQTISLASLADTLSGLTCAPGQVAKWNVGGTAWECAADIDTDTTYTNVSEFTNDSGYLTAEVDGSITNEVNTAINLTAANLLQITDSNGTLSVSLAGLADTLSNLTCTPGQVAKWNAGGTAWECATDIDTDTDTTYTAGTGITLTGTAFSIDNANIAPAWANLTGVPADIADGDDDTLFTAGSGLSLTGAQFAVNAPTCTATQKLSWNGTAFQCLTDIDTNTDTDTTYAAGNGIALTGTTFSANAPTCTATEKLTWNGTAFQCAADIDTDTDTDTTYTAGTGLSLAGTTFNLSGTPGTVTSIATGNGLTGGPIATTGTVAINAPTCTATQKLTWNGTAFQCATDADTNTTYTAGTGLSLAGTTFNAADPIIGNEVLNATTNGGLARAGAGTAANPYTLGLITSCADDEVLVWNDTTSVWACGAAAGSDDDWYEVGGTDSPDAITDNIFTQGDVSIGSADNNARLYVEDAINTTTTGATSSYSYIFNADNDADEAAWTFVSDNGGNGLNPASTNRSWSHDVNDTGSANVGPTSGQGGDPEGYVYTEASAPTAYGDTFHMTHNATLDASTDDWEVDFYWNQRGDSNLSVLNVQTNENGAGWVTRGTYGTGGPDVASGGVQSWNNETLDLAGLISGTSTQIRFLVTIGGSGTVWHNDFGLDTITISSPTASGYGDTVAEVYNADATSDVDLLRLSSDVGGTQDVKFRVDSDGDVYSDGTSFLGGGADIAEMYENDDDAQIGDVVVFADKITVQKSTEENEVALAGVIATKPAVVLGANVDGLPVALSGRVPVKFSAVNGAAQRGDYLTSGPDGSAVKALSAGQVIGAAMEEITEDGFVEIFVGVGYWAPADTQEKSIRSAAEVTVEEGRGIVGEVVDGVQTIISDMIVSANAIFENTVTFLSEVTFMERITYTDQDTGGFAVIGKGQKEITVEFEKSFLEEPVVTVTPQESFTTFIVSDISKDSFTIKAEKNLDADVRINWVALSIAGAKTHETAAENVESKVISDETTKADEISIPKEEFTVEEVDKEESQTELEDEITEKIELPKTTESLAETINEGEDSSREEVEQQEVSAPEQQGESSEELPITDESAQEAKQ